MEASEAGTVAAAVAIAAFVLQSTGADRALKRLVRINGFEKPILLGVVAFLAALAVPRLLANPGTDESRQTNKGGVKQLAASEEHSGS